MGPIEGWATEAIEAFSYIKPLADRLPQDQFEVTTEDRDGFGDAPQHFLNSVARAVGLRQAIHVRSAPQLARLWEWYVKDDGRYRAWEYTEAGAGIAAAVRVGQ